MNNFNPSYKRFKHAERLKKIESIMKQQLDVTRLLDQQLKIRQERIGNLFQRINRLEDKIQQLKNEWRVE
ncbi:hypothetical protein GCM10028805_41300 [Spirosoma harenae]